MVLDDVLRMDQNTIGAEDLSSFITALDELAARSPEQPSDEITQATTRLNASLDAWNRSLARHSDAVAVAEHRHAAHPQDATPSADVSPEVDVLQNVDRHLHRLVLRHSNFGFAAVNVPSSLDALFPEGALVHVRSARPHLRRAISLLSNAA